MVLVSYSDSDSDTCQPESQRPATTSSAIQLSRKRKIKDTPTPTTSTTRAPPPLPPSFHSLYATNVRTSTTDDPSLHGGRKRQVVHVQGNWPSHISLEWLPDKSQLASLDDLIEQSRQVVTASDALASDDFQFNAFLRSSLSAQLPLHISLSAPLVLSTSTKDEFRDALVDAVGAAKLGEIAVQPVSLDLVPNFERSRWFLVLRVREAGERKLTTLLRVCNDVCDGFGLPLLYQRSDVVGVDTTDDGASGGERRVKKVKGSGGEVVDVDGSVDTEPHRNVANAFHISIAWALQEVSEVASSAVRGINLKGLDKAMVKFDRVKIKTGNIVDDIVL